jgi:RsiW-degrading membrane proteinase PrsW (M82 family)
MSPTVTTPERVPDLAVLFPVRAWLRHPAVRAWPTWAFVALVGVPPAALALFPGSSGLLGLAIVLAAYFAAVWFLVLRAVVRPHRVGAALVAQVAVAELVLVLAYLFGVGPDVEAHGNLFVDVAAIGLPEELLKLLPVVAVVLLQRRLRFAPRDVLFLAATSGLVFGAIEAVDYAVLLNDYSGAGMALVLRFATDSISHALWAGVAGYFLGLATHHRAAAPRLALAGIGLGVPVLLHGVNDWTPVNGTVLWVGVQVVSALLFLGYARIGVVAPRPAPSWGPPAAAGPIPAPRSAEPAHPGRHAADDDAVTRRLVLVPGAR